MVPLVVSMMQALGDAVYQRPFLRAQSQVRHVYADACFPEVYKDLPNVHPVRPVPLYRPAARNVARLEEFPWASPPEGDHETARFLYVLARPDLTIARDLERRVPLAGQPFVFDLPTFGPAPLERPYAVVRPVSVRADWPNPARNPSPEYVAEAARMLRARGLLVVLVGDLGDEEEAVGVLPEADLAYTAGELTQPELFALVEHASVVTGGVGWLVPTAVAYRTPAVFIGGGVGGHNAPAKLVDPRMDARRVRFVLPEPYCMCRSPRHPCPKRIPDFARQFARALDETMGVAA